MHQPADMNYRNPLFYLLTQVVGVTALLGWLAYQIQYSSLDTHVTGFFYDWVHRVFPVRDEPMLESIERLAIWVLPGLGALLSGAAALLSYRRASLRPARAALWILFLLFCLTPLIIELLRSYTMLAQPFGSHGLGGAAALPGSYAATGFVLFGLYFSGWALNRSRLRWWGLALAVIAGTLFGGLRIVQGAHFLSQTVWSAALAWLLCSLLFYPLIVTRHRRELADLNSYTVGEVWTHLSQVQVQRRKTLTAYGLLLVCLLPVFSSSWAGDSWMHDAIEWAGLVLILVAVLGRCWCILYLGGHKGSNLIDQGPYSISRNPLYMFSMVAVTGIGAQSGSLLLGPILALFVYAVFNNVIDEEERLLRKVFGPAFDEYCARVPRFGPRFATWETDDHVTISMSGLRNTMRDALPYFLAVPLFELVEQAQTAGWLPTLIHLP